MFIKMVSVLILLTFLTGCTQVIKHEVMGEASYYGYVTGDIRIIIPDIPDMEDIPTINFPDTITINIQ